MRLLLLVVLVGVCAGARLPAWSSTLSSTPLKPLTSAGQCIAEANVLNNRIRELASPAARLDGTTWVSSGCETLPDGEFALRFIRFYPDGRFLHRHHRYYDMYCTHPKESLRAQGHVKPIGQSLSVPGATDVKVQLDRLEHIPYTKQAANELTQSLRTTCHIEKGQTFPWPQLLPYRLVTVHQAARTKAEKLRAGLAAGTTDEIGCAGSVNFTVDGFALMMRDSVQNQEANMISRLHVGMPLWDWHQQAMRTPSHFAPALLQADKATLRACPTCKLVLAADETRPPRLQTPKPSKADYLNAPISIEQQLDGDWLSTECESHIHGMFVHRQLSYLSDARLWVLRHRYYQDPLCSQPHYTLTVRGLFHVLQPLDRIGLRHTRRIRYHVDAMQLMPESATMAENFAYASACGPSDTEWRVGVNVDVTAAGGCPVLGVPVPTAVDDLLRLEGIGQSALLYTGDLASMSQSTGLPSVFRAPLRRCAAGTEVVPLGDSGAAGGPSIVDYNSRYQLAYTAGAAGRQPQQHWLLLLLLAGLMWAAGVSRF